MYATENILSKVPDHFFLLWAQSQPVRLSQVSEDQGPVSGPVSLHHGVQEHQRGAADGGLVEKQTSALWLQVS